MTVQTNISFSVVEERPIDGTGAVKIIARMEEGCATLAFIVKGGEELHGLTYHLQGDGVGDMATIANALAEVMTEYQKQIEKFGWRT